MYLCKQSMQFTHPQNIHSLAFVNTIEEMVLQANKKYNEIMSQPSKSFVFIFQKKIFEKNVENNHFFGCFLLIYE